MSVRRPVGRSRLAAPQATLGWAERSRRRFGPGRSARRPATHHRTGLAVFGVRPGGGGLYSYDRLENLFGLGFRSADRIIPERQTLAVRGQVWLAPRDSAVPLWYQVIDLQPGLLANNYGLEPVHFRMEQKLLLDSKHRAEQTPPS